MPSRLAWMSISLLAGLLPVLAACADFESSQDPAFGLPDVVVSDPSFTRDVAPIFATRCATGGCHTSLNHQAGMVLERGVAYDNIVGVPSTNGNGLLRVDPGNADSSWLVRRIGPDPARRFGQPRMPLGTYPLTPNQIQTITNWVNRGALRN